MQRTLIGVFKPVVTDLTHNNEVTLGEVATSFFVAPLIAPSKAKDVNIMHPKLSDISVGKAINPFALTRSVVLTTAFSAGWGIDALGGNSLPAQGVKAIVMTPLTMTAAILTPFSKIDEGINKIIDAVGEQTEKHNAVQQAIPIQAPKQSSVASKTAQLALRSEEIASYAQHNIHISSTTTEKSETERSIATNSASKNNKQNEEEPLKIGYKR